MSISFLALASIKKRLWMAGRLSLSSLSKAGSRYRRLRIDRTARVCVVMSSYTKVTLAEPTYSPVFVVFQCPFPFFSSSIVFIRPFETDSRNRPVADVRKSEPNIARRQIARPLTEERPCATRTVRPHLLLPVCHSKNWEKLSAITAIQSGSHHRQCFNVRYCGPRN